MPVVMRATARTKAVASAGGLSASRGGSVRVAVSGLDNIASAWVAIGPVLVGPPATYDAFTADEGTRFVTNPSSMQVVYDGGTFTYTATADFVLDGSGLTEGDEVWAGVFMDGDSPPAGAEVPVATAGRFAVVA